MIRSRVLAFALFVVIVIALTNLFEVLFSAAFTHSAYVFSFSTGVLIPLVVSTVVGYFAFLRDKGEH